MLHDHDGKISLSRVLAVILILLYAVIAVVHYIRTGVFLDVPSSLVVLVLGLYTANRGAQVALEAFGKE